MAGRFETRLAEGPPIVADGGMGSLLTAAVPRLRSPEEANLRAPEAVVSLHVSFIKAGAELIETNTFGANRRKLAAHYLEDELRADQLDRGQARPRGARADRARRLHRRRDRPARRGGEPAASGASSSPSRRRCSRAAAPTSSCSRRSTTSRSSSTRSRPCARVSALPIVALLTFDETRRDARRGHGAPGGRAPRRRSGVAAFGANHGAGLLAALTALEQMQADGRAARRAPEHRPREPRSAAG